MDRIIDVNLNRASEALRTIEEIARFYLDNGDLSEKLKLIRHNLSVVADKHYSDLLQSRNTQDDVGTIIANPTEKRDITDVYKAGFKRLQQSLRVLSEFAQANGIEANMFEGARYESYTLEKIMFEELSKKIKKERIKNKKLYLVTSSMPSQDEFLDRVALALKGGVQIVQLREKAAPAKDIIELGIKLRELCSLYDALFIVNDRVDIAKITCADGVHLGQDDIEIKQARKILGDEAIIGVSTHSPDQAKEAMDSGADYIGVGPVFETPTKPGKKAVGLEYVKWASQNADIPWFAIGGINSENLSEVLNAGVSSVAVVRAIMNAENPEIAAKNFLSRLDR